MRQFSSGSNGIVLWLTGLSGAGKSTLAHALRDELSHAMTLACVLDGDDVRRGLSCDLGFSETDRAENNRRVAEVARLMASAGMTVIVALISPYRKYRHCAREIVETSEVPFFEIFVDTPLAVCEERDVKGFYKRARASEIQNFTGVQVPYEKPLSPDAIVFPAKESVTDSVAAVMRVLLSKIDLPMTKDTSVSATRTMDANWRNWTQINIERRCDPLGVKQILLENGFAPNEIAGAMGQSYPRDGVDIDFEELANVRITQPESGAVKFESHDLQLYTLDRFLSHAECEELIEIINQNLRPSTLTVESKDKHFRTSSTCHLSECGYPLVNAIDERIAATLGIDLAYSEGIQAQKYLPGQQFKPHTDFFEPGTAEYKAHCAKTGNRTWTFMIYLSDVEKGGGTAFSRVGHVFFPKRGMAVVWNNLRRDGTPNRFSVHSGEPVEEGAKIIITKWFRERGTGKMFLRDCSAAVGWQR